MLELRNKKKVLRTQHEPWEHRDRFFEGKKIRGELAAL